MSPHLVFTLPGIITSAHSYKLIKQGGSFHKIKANSTNCSRRVEQGCAWTTSKHLLVNPSTE